MAEDKKEQEIEGKSKNKIRIIIGIISVVFLLAAAGAAYFFFVNNDEVKDNIAKLPEKAIYVKLKTEEGRKMFITSVKTKGDRARIMQVYAEAKTRSKEASDALKMHMPVVISKLNTLFGKQEFHVIKTYEGKRKMKRDATEILNEVLREKEGINGVETVFFTGIVIQ
jgi:flagellar FliL protein